MMPQPLLVVRRGHPQPVDTLRASFAKVPDVAVGRDRRVGGRRQETRRRGTERCSGPDRRGAASSTWTELDFRMTTDPAPPNTLA